MEEVVVQVLPKALHPMESLSTVVGDVDIHVTAEALQVSGITDEHSMVFHWKLDATLPPLPQNFSLHCGLTPQAFRIALTKVQKKTPVTLRIKQDEDEETKQPYRFLTLEDTERRTWDFEPIDVGHVTMKMSLDHMRENMRRLHSAVFKRAIETMAPVQVQNVRFEAHPDAQEFFMIVYGRTIRRISIPIPIVQDQTPIGWNNECALAGEYLMVYFRALVKIAAMTSDIWFKWVDTRLFFYFQLTPSSYFITIIAPIPANCVAKRPIQQRHGETTTPPAPKRALRQASLPAPESTSPAQAEFEEEDVD